MVPVGDERMDAYVLVEAGPRPARELRDEFRALTIEGAQLQSVDVVTGPYEFVIRVRADDLDALSNFVSEGVHSVRGVASTTTCIAWRS